MPLEFDKCQKVGRIYQIGWKNLPWQAGQAVVLYEEQLQLYPTATNSRKKIGLWIVVPLSSYKWKGV
jgi:hypothetical protein